MRQHIFISLNVLFITKAFFSNIVKMEKKNHCFVMLVGLSSAFKFCADAPKIFNRNYQAYEWKTLV